MTNRINLFSKVFIFLSITSLFIGLFFGEDSSGSGGFVADYKNTWGYIEALKINVFTLPGNWTVHTPLHYIIISRLNLLFQNEFFLKIIFLNICLSIPTLFFFCLKIKYPKIDINNLVLLTLIIFIFPAFRSSVIWINAHATAMIFFLSFLYFFLIWEKREYENRFSINIFCQIFFLALTVYSRQYYAYFYAYVMIIYFAKFSLVNFLKISFFVLIFSIPGFFLIFLEPKILKTTYDLNFYNTILISSSIILFYLIPFYLLRWFEIKKVIFKNTKNIKYLVLLILLLLITFFLSTKFNYNYKLGGGFFLKLSYLLFNNNILFLSSSVLGLIALVDLFKKDKNNLLLIIIFLFGFSSYMIFQKYFEPIFFMIFLLMMNYNLTSNIISKIKNIYFLYLYFFMYFIVAIINDIFKITKNLT